MGKNLQHQESGITLQNNQPKCMWSILHVLNYNRWHHVKKMLPYRKHTGGKQIAVVEDSGSNMNTASVAEVPNQTGEASKQTSEVQKQSGEISKRTAQLPKHAVSKTEKTIAGEKTKERNPVSKVSRRFRIMFMFTEEMYRRTRGRSRRSASHSVHPPDQHQISSTQQKRKDDNDLPAVDSVNDRPMLTNHDGKSAPPDHPPHTPRNKNCELCAAMLTASCSMSSSADHGEKGVVNNNTEGTRIEGKDASSPEESKLYLNALDIFNTRKELFLQAMQEPKSPMAANHLNSPRESNSEKRITKSGSFLAGENGDDSTTSNQTPKVGYSNNFTPGSPRPLSNEHDSTAVLTRFKNLRQKLRHVIQEDRKEKQRILMDGFLHKIPYGRRLSKDTMETVEFPEPPGAKSQNKFTRTASLNESVDKYCRLFEHTLNKETKQQNLGNCKLRVEETQRVEETPSTSKSAPKKLARIQSLPDMQSYQYHGDYTVTPNKDSVDRDVGIGHSKFDEHKIRDPKNQSDSVAQTGGEESLGKHIKSLDDLGDLAKDERRFEHGQETEHKLMPSPELEKSPHDSVVELNSHEDKSVPVDVSEPKDSPSPVEPTMDIQSIDIPGKQNHIDFLQARVERKDRVEFNYVKDVLEAAGFGETNFQETWHTTGQPVDPTVFAEVGGCLVEEPLNEEGDKCNHLLLFDLINEVLLEIHERSFTWCPMPLICRSEMHPMPVGYHILEQVWANVHRYLSWRPEFDQSLDDAVSKDLGKGDGWMNLQFEAEFVGLELEDMVFDELLDEFIWE